MKTQDLRRAVAGALALEELQSAFGGRKTAVVYPDLTRPLDAEAVLDPVLAALRAVGADVTVVVALGLHRPLSDEELAPIRAVTAQNGYTLQQHDPRGELVTIEEDVRTPEARRAGVGPLPAKFAPLVAQAEAILSIGLVEPHQYAGYSGGAKGLAIGCGSAETIGSMHGTAFLKSPQARIGRVAENPFQGALWRLIRALPAPRGLMIVPPVGRDTWAAFAGPLTGAFQRAVGLAADRLFQKFDEPRAWMHVVVPEAKAQSFYQASRARRRTSRWCRRPRSPPRDGSCSKRRAPKGLGQGAGELAFAEALGRGPAALAAEWTSGATISGGAQRAFRPDAGARAGTARAGRRPGDAGNSTPSAFGAFPTSRARKRRSG